VLIRIANPTSLARVAETIALPLRDIAKFWVAPKQILLFDPTGTLLISQLVDTDGDESPDELLFQTDLGPSETKTFSLRFGVRAPTPRDDYRVYGRFVRERHDDFAWENDRIARRMYGPGLESWSREPLTSSGIDAWSKRTKRLVVNDWYLTDDYHHDGGEGADLYSVGRSRGCGGLGVWVNEALHVSRNFVQSRVLANGPLRLIFELDYAAWTAAGRQIAETKRITLDAGKHFERYESTFKFGAPRDDLLVGIGIAKHKGSDVSVDPAGHWILTWEPMAENSHFGCVVVLSSAATGTPKQTDTDYLFVTPASPSGRLVYYAGFGWDRSGDVADAAAWGGQVQTLARELAAPATVAMAPGPGAMPWSARACESMMTREPRTLTSRWHYDSGFVLMSCLQAATKHKNPQHAAFVKRAVDDLVAPDGTITGYELDEYNIDDINMGKVLFPLYSAAKDPQDRQRYEKALRLLRTQMKTQPRTKEGGYWHKKIYPHQMWLDGAYMAAPFLAEFAQVFGEAALFDEVSNELLLLEHHTRDPKTGLLYHGWDESKQQRWADKRTGTSPHFWGRAMGWYAMALVDVLELLPAKHPKRTALIAVLNRLATAIAKVQDPQTGAWWQVLDAPKRAKNYRESSATAMFVYALSKGITHGWLDAKRFGDTADFAFRGMLEQFVAVDGTGRLEVTQVCKVAGLGGDPYRDGSYDYYTTTEVVANDPKGVGAFIMASLQRE
jgi:unsaturated rhamnogalacturonyl hydrolase